MDLHLVAELAGVRDIGQRRPVVKAHPASGFDAVVAVEGLHAVVQRIPITACCLFMLAGCEASLPIVLAGIRPLALELCDVLLGDRGPPSSPRLAAGRGRALRQGPHQGKLPGE